MPCLGQPQKEELFSLMCSEETCLSVPLVEGMGSFLAVIKRKSLTERGGLELDSPTPTQWGWRMSLPKLKEFEEKN
jgi:hypothetical protein